jgi:hypothetical protein
MKMLINIRGATEKIGQLRALKQGIRPELETAMNEAGQILMDGTQYYPPSQGDHRRSGLYGKTQTFNVFSNGAQVFGQANYQQPYSIYLRGTQDGSYRGAWMHLGIWESLADIIERVLPRMVAKLSDRLDQFIKSIMGV